MRDQLLHIADVAAMLDNVTLQVVEFSAGVHASPHGSFSVVELPWPDDPGVVFLETGPTGVTFLDRRSEVYLHAEVFQHLVDEAASPEESVDILRTAAASYGRSRSSK